MHGEIDEPDDDEGIDDGVDVRQAVEVHCEVRESPEKQGKADVEDWKPAHA